MRHIDQDLPFHHQNQERPMVPAFVRFAVAAGSILLIPKLARAQTEGVAIDPSTRAEGQDSVSVLAKARTAQASFERFRFARLPRSWSRSSGRCDETIGRFCFFFSDSEQGDHPPPE